MTILVKVLKNGENPDEIEFTEFTTAEEAKAHIDAAVAEGGEKADEGAGEEATA